MTEDQSREALRIYEEAVTRKAGERGAYLDAACGANAGLRREVEGLLAESSGSADGFLNAPPWQGPAL